MALPFPRFKSPNAKIRWKLIRGLTHMIFRQLDDRRDSKDFIVGLVFIDVTIVIVVTLSDNRTDVTLPKLKIALKRHLVTKILRRPR